MVSFQRNAFQSHTAQRPHAEWMTSSIIRCLFTFPDVQANPIKFTYQWVMYSVKLRWLLFLSHCVLQLREYCLRLRNMVASDATKAELSSAMDSMIEEVRLKGRTQPFHLQYFILRISARQELCQAWRNFLPGGIRDEFMYGKSQHPESPCSEGSTFQRLRNYQGRVCSPENRWLIKCSPCACYNFVKLQ